MDKLSGKKDHYHYDHNYGHLMMKEAGRNFLWALEFHCFYVRRVELSWAELAITIMAYLLKRSASESWLDESWSKFSVIILSPKTNKYFRDTNNNKKSSWRFFLNFFFFSFFFCFVAGWIDGWLAASINQSTCHYDLLSVKKVKKIKTKWKQKGLERTAKRDGWTVGTEQHL